jgi:hypothetical protein
MTKLVNCHRNPTHSILKTCVIAVLTISAFSALSSCSGKRPDQVVDVCFQSSNRTDEAVKKLQGVSDRFGYRFREYGSRAKSDLEAINADRLIFPSGRPVQADIERKNGTILVIASNFGDPGPTLRLSFFYQRNEGKDSPFFRALLSELSSIPDARLNSRGDDGASSCTTET